MHFRLEFSGKLSKKPDKFKFRRIGRAVGIGYIKHNGNCCIKIYQKFRYRGRNQLLKKGFDGTPAFSIIRSMKYGVCESSDKNYWLNWI